jgi:hypothetical protein
MARLLAFHFDVNPLEVKCEGLEVARAARDLGHIQRELATTSFALFEQALDMDDYVLAGRLLKVARLASAETNDAPLRMRALSASDRFKKLREEYVKVKPALAKLAAQPEDRAACLAVGKFLCIKDDWEEGLPLLKKSGEPALADLAGRDLAEPADAAGQRTLGLDWLVLPAKGSDFPKAPCQRRAVYWLRAAMPGLDGKQKRKIETQLKSLYKEDSLLGEPWPHLVLDDATVAEGSFSLRNLKAAPTKRAYQGPIEFTVVARTAKNNIRLCAGCGGMVIFNWELKGGELRVHRPDGPGGMTVGSFAGGKQAPLGPNKWYELRWRLTTTGMKVWVDGKLVFEEDQPYDLSAREPVAVQAFDSVIDVKSVVVRRIR